MTTINTTNLDEVVQMLIEKGGYDGEDLAPLETWLRRGDDILVFELADLGVVLSGNYPLYWSMPWDRREPTPRQAPDTEQCGLGWRYLPTYRVSVETSDV